MGSAARSRRPGFHVVLGFAGFVLLLVTGVALAATFGVVSTKLATSTGASSITPTSCTLSAADADSYVDQGSAGTNFGTAGNLSVQSRSGSRNRRTFVRIDLASCSIPANSLITAASLKLTMYAAPTAGRTYEARRVTAPWTEVGITWTSQPGAAVAATSTVATGTTANVVLAWTVTADVQAFVDGTANYGWRIHDQTESSTTARVGQFRSAEYGAAANRPILEITYYP